MKHPQRRIINLLCSFFCRLASPETQRDCAETSAGPLLRRYTGHHAHIYRDGTCPTHAPSHLPLMLLYYCSTLHTLHTRLEGAVVGVYGLLFARLALPHPREGLPIILHRRLSLSLARSHLLAGPCYLELLRAVTPHRWFSLSSQPIALGDSGADVRGGPRGSSGESVSSASSSSKVSTGVICERRPGTVKRGDRPKGLAEGDAPRAARESLLSKASLPR